MYEPASKMAFSLASRIAFRMVLTGTPVCSSSFSKRTGISTGRVMLGDLLSDWSEPPTGNRAAREKLRHLSLVVCRMSQTAIEYPHHKELPPPFK